MKQETNKLFWNAFFIISIFVLGYCSNIAVREISNKRIYDGLNIRGANHSLAMKIASNMDSNGDWVCVNVRGLNYDRCVEISSHECAHELFAEACERDDELCKQTQELLNNYTNK